MNHSRLFMELAATEKKEAQRHPDGAGEGVSKTSSVCHFKQHLGCGIPVSEL